MKLSSDMRRSNVKLDVWTYASLIAACQSCGNRWQDALAFLQDMQDEGGVAGQSLAPQLWTEALDSGCSYNLYNGCY